MSLPFPSYDDGLSFVNATTIAIEKDKNSQHAVRWAVDHLVITNPLVVLIHVKQKNSNQGDAEADDTPQIFVPYRGYCARKGVQLKEIVIEDNDVSKALLDYISKMKFKNQDVPSSLMKSAPDYCSVYVISKGKIMSVRLAARPAANTAAPPRIPSVQLADRAEFEDGHSRGQITKGSLRNASSERTSFDRSSDYTGPVRERARSASPSLSLDNIDVGVYAPRSSISRSSVSDEIDMMDGFSRGSMDVSDQNLDFSVMSNSPRKTSASQSARDMDAEMRRLKLELKQTMDKYSTACKEALSAKKKTNELSQWKVDESHKFEEARLAGEAALAIAEMEKSKTKAAIEAAEMSQKLAGMEAQRRRQAEMKAKREEEEKNRALTALAKNDIRYRKYTIEEIEEATSKFSDSNKVGEGGYGPVYKGKLDHTPVAIKVLRPDAAQGKKQFQQEVGATQVLSTIRHPNMVLLLGACPEYGCLVYEYMNRGSLEDRLFCKGNTPPLSWRNRFTIAAEIATALLFLHQAKPEPLVHRDLKPANILLDRNYVSKISDVGLARLVPPSVADTVTQYHMTSAAGTFCYIDPEYQQTGQLTTRSDIYLLGIMLLQIITAKSPMGISHHVGRAIENGKFADMLDPAVVDWPVEEALEFAKLALKCVELRKKDRPDLVTVIVPELNRLRDLGRNAEPHGSNGYTQHSGHGNRAHSHSHGQSSSSYSGSPLLQSPLTTVNQVYGLP
ncbi:U-box domain-containing protein 51-like isoform X3 [Tripterygium wilfordii]|uniref:RING-type E3 ubiquitin transferase n=1 Tax=Tripterygium wilfordii TaxID=458696 RepID=A0A7J7DPU7_TRIWF|nr:U-box domain-containing protein 51-like isoform X3 [Tripterygium wilfordii]